MNKVMFKKVLRNKSERENGGWLKASCQDLPKKYFIKMLQRLFIPEENDLFDAT